VITAEAEDGGTGLADRRRLGVPFDCTCSSISQLP
jgi:hypothetical protein